MELETVHVRRDAFSRAWSAAGSPTLNEMVARATALDEPPLARSTVHALRAYAMGSGHPAYSGRIGIRKAQTVARVLGVELGDLFEHATGDPIRTLSVA